MRLAPVARRVRTRALRGQGAAYSGANCPARLAPLCLRPPGRGQQAVETHGTRRHPTGLSLARSDALQAIHAHYLRTAVAFCQTPNGLVLPGVTLLAS